MDRVHDVIVVGGGNAALCAALSAREHGAEVLVLERAPEAQRGGNSAYTGGGFRMVHHGAETVRSVVPDLSEGEIANTDFGEYTAEQYLDDLGRVTQWHCDPDLAETVVRGSTETVRWLNGRGVRFVPRFGRYAFRHEGRFKFFGGTVVEAAGGGRGLVKAEYQAAEKQGIAIRYGTQVVALLRGGGGVKGVRAVAGGVEEEIRARAVVLASGGFEANREWRTRYLGPGWDMAKVRGTRYNTGDGIRMALDIGAQAYGQWSGCHSVSWERHAPDFGEIDRPVTMSRNGYPFGIMVNAEGRRFVDEGADFRNYTYAKYGRSVLEQPGSYAWHVFDSQVEHLLHEEYRSRGTTRVLAGTLEELVARMEDVDPPRFLETVRAFNAAVKRDVAFNPNIKDGKCTTGLAINKSNWANPIEKPPFSAYAVTCGITFTFGGLKIDTAARVLDIADAPLPGLYAAGELVGGLFYYNYPGSSGLMAGAVFGRIAGREAAAHARGARSKAGLTMKDAEKATTRLRRLLHRKDKVLAVLHPPTATHGRIMELAGCECGFVGTSGVVGSYTGLADVGTATMTECVMIGGWIASSVKFPIILDGDTGHGGIMAVRRLVRESIRAGIAGIRIDDQPIEGKRRTQSAGVEVVPIEQALARYRAAVDMKNELDPDFVVMAQCYARDAANSNLEDCIRRLQAYERDAGVDWVQLESPHSTEEIRQARAAVQGPFSFMKGKLPRYLGLDEHLALGVNIAWYPGFTHEVMWAALHDFMQDFQSRGIAAWEEFQARRKNRPYPRPDVGPDGEGGEKQRELEEKYLSAAALKKYRD